jgi:hypothetical protein
VAKKVKSKRDGLWTEAKQKCHLSNADIQIAKEMGLNPQSLIKNIPSRSEPWKVPVRNWIHEMYRKRREKAARKKPHRDKSSSEN